MKTQGIEQRYEAARERYAELGVDTDRALEVLAGIPISLHCWQGDDVAGFERSAEGLSGGIAVTGNHPGAARGPEELRQDLDRVLSLLPGRHRLNLHAIYGEFGGKKVDRDEVGPEHFAGWIEWAKGQGMGLDFNPTFFSHRLSADGFTLTHADPAVRGFWVEHGRRCREIGAVMGRALGSATVTNVWIPDGFKDLPVDRKGPRERLAESLDAMFAEDLDPAEHLDSVESKLFGIGSESYVAGSHEFYMGYAVSRRKVLCLDAGHFHPTEGIADKISSVLQFVPRLLLHVSRGVRWDSDHVVVLGDDLLATAQELVRGDFLGRTHVGLDFFDASINRIAAWVIGTRAMIKALLVALLEPAAKLREMEAAGDFTGRLAMLEELKMMPFGAVWDHHCERAGVPAGLGWLEEVRRYERDVLSRRAVQPK
jgi:L-rhamnose isomerase